MSATHARQLPGVAGATSRPAWRAASRARASRNRTGRTRVPQGDVTRTGQAVTHWWMRRMPSSMSASAIAKLKRGVAGSAERLAGHERHLRLAEDGVGQLERVVAHGAVGAERATEQTLDVRVAVERTLRLDGGDAGDVVEHAVHRDGAALERLAHHRHRRQVAADRFERRRLRHVGDVRGAVRLVVDRGLHHVGRADHPADAPAGHRVRLGDAVDDDALVGELGHHGGHADEAVVAVHEVLVDLVGEHPHALLDGPAADGLDLLGRVDGAARVVGADEQQHLRARRERGVELLDRDLEAGGLVGLHDDRHATGERDGLGVGGPVRRGADDLVARVAQRGERGEHRVLAAVGDEHLAGLAAEPAVAQGLRGDGLAQRGQACRRRVLVHLRVAARPHRGLDDVLRRGEVGLAGAEPDDVLALRLQRLGLRIDGQGGGFGNGGETGRGAVHRRRDATRGRFVRP